MEGVDAMAHPPGLPGIALLCRRGDVQVWRVELRLPEPVLAERAEWLSPVERERADRQRARPDVRRRFVAARSGLRQILSDFMGVAADVLEIAEGPDGKPEVRGGPSFSLSHSGELALCAVCPGRAVGVDLEALRSVAGAEEIARRWFTENELLAFESARGADPQAAFLRIWTRKEAYLKALGVGLSGLSAHPAPDPGAWEVHDLDPGPGYVASLVAARGGP